MFKEFVCLSCGFRGKLKTGDVFAKCPVCDSVEYSSYLVTVEEAKLKLVEITQLKALLENALYNWYQGKED